MTNRERTRTKYAVAVVAAALVASLALVATVGLTRKEANRREPQGAPPNRPIAGIVGGGDAPSTEFPWMVIGAAADDAAADARVLADVATDGTIGNTRRPPRAARGLGDGRAGG